MKKKQVVQATSLSHQPALPSFPTGPARYCSHCGRLVPTFGKIYNVHFDTGGTLCPGSSRAVAAAQTAPLQTPLTGGSRDEPVA